MDCNHFMEDSASVCGAPTTKAFIQGPRCPDHTPARLAGRPETVPDPDLTLIGLRKAAGVADPEAPMTPSGETVVDARAKASGKRRSSPNAQRAARAQTERETPEERAEREERAAAARAPKPGPRDGATFDPDADEVRLNAQGQRVWDAIQDGAWHTLAELAQATGDPEASISARLRDLRKPQFGGENLVAEKVPGTNRFRYRLLIEDPVAW